MRLGQMVSLPARPGSYQHGKAVLIPKQARCVLARRHLKQNVVIPGKRHVPAFCRSILRMGASFTALRCRPRSTRPMIAHLTGMRCITTLPIGQTGRRVGASRAPGKTIRWKATTFPNSNALGRHSLCATGTRAFQSFQFGRAAVRKPHEL